MTEKQKAKVDQMAYAIFFALRDGFKVTDEKGNLVKGLRFGSKENPDGCDYLVMNKSSHLIHLPVGYSSNKKTPACKKFYVDKGGKRPEIIK